MIAKVRILVSRPNLELEAHPVELIPTSPRKTLTIVGFELVRDKLAQKRNPADRSQSRVPPPWVFA